MHTSLYTSHTILFPIFCHLIQTPALLRPPTSSSSSGATCPLRPSIPTPIRYPRNGEPARATRANSKSHFFVQFIRNGGTKTRRTKQKSVAEHLGFTSRIHTSLLKIDRTVFFTRNYVGDRLGREDEHGNAAPAVLLSVRSPTYGRV